VTIRLGDVVSATDGIVGYDHVRSYPGGPARRRRDVEGFLRADRELATQGLFGRNSWTDALLDRSLPDQFRRPSANADPRARRGIARGTPHVHRGRIGSAERVVRDRAVRDRIAADYGLMAVEMEGSGVAVGSDLHGMHWYIVRGVAALAAAAYVRALLGRAPADGDRRAGSGRRKRPERDRRCAARAPGHPGRPLEQHADLPATLRNPHPGADSSGSSHPRHHADTNLRAVCQRCRRPCRCTGNDDGFCRLPRSWVLATILWMTRVSAGCPMWTVVAESGAVSIFSSRTWRT